MEIRTPVETELQWAWEYDWYKGLLRVTDETGREIPSQIVQELSVLPGFRSRIVFVDDLPALGYKTYFVHKREKRGEQGTAYPAADFEMESRRYRLEVCRETGCIRTLVDKSTGACILENSARAVIREDEGDTWCFNIESFGPVIGGVELESSRLVETGPIRSVIRVKGRFKGHEGSWFEQDYILYNQEDILERRFRVHWRERHRVLKLLFTPVMTDPVFRVSVPYGSMLRERNGREMPCGEWLSLSEPGREISLITDSIFAYDMADCTLALTLLRSPIHGHLTWKEPIDPDADYHYLGQGVREGAWRLVDNDGSQAGLPNLAAAFNNPVITICEGIHPGSLPRTSSFLEINASSSRVTVLKGCNAEFPERFG